MNKETRIQKIGEILARNDASLGGIEIPWQDDLILKQVYKVPLEYLTYNKYNGRILSRTKSLEQQGQQIEADTECGRVLLEKLLWDSDRESNKKTLESIGKIGQEKPGVITRDGIIIDGNRRAMLLARSGKFKTFKTVVLDVTLEQAPTEIERLETTYQMGEDAKVDYNPIEKYLKAKFLHKSGVSKDDIANWMGQKYDIDDLLDTMAVMDDYLDYLGCNGIYTQLDGREDQFLTLTKQVKAFYSPNTSLKPFSGYTDADVDDLKLISYDYIRVSYEGKEFRRIAHGAQDKHFFGDKKIWESFRDYHFKHVDPIKDLESKIDFSSENLTQHLNERNAAFFNKTKNDAGMSFFNDNIDLHNQQIQNKLAKNEPSKLVNKAIDALEAVDQGNKAFALNDVQQKIEDISELVFTMLKKKSPVRLLSQVLEILKSVDCDECENEKERALEKIKEIEKVAYQMEKAVKSL